MTEPTTDPIEAVAQAFAEAPRPEIADARASIDAESLAMAEAAMRILVGLGAAMPDEATKLRGGQCDALCRDVEQDRDRLRADLEAHERAIEGLNTEVLKATRRYGRAEAVVADALALCREIRPDSVIGTSPAARLGLIEAVLSRQPVQSVQEASE
jgi:hypothetical protein